MRKMKLNKGMIATILTLAWPTMLEELMQTAVQYIDTAMVGSLGTQATAAVGATSTVGWLVFSTVSAIGVGFLSFIARAYGAGDKEAAARAVAQTVFMTVVTGMAVTIITVGLSGRIPVWMQVDESIRSLASQYFLILYLPMLPRTAMIIFGTALRAAGDSKTPMKVGIAVNVVNVVLNFLLIYPTRAWAVLGMTLTLPGAGWGVLGAAAASAISFTVGGIFITFALWKHPMLSPKGQSFRPDGEILLPCLKVAVPNMFQRFGSSLGYVFFASMINALGDVATAAHTIANTVESAFYIPGYGMQAAAATLAGNAYGANDKVRMNELARMFIPIEIGLMILSGGALFLSAEALVSLFSHSPEVIALGSRVLRMVALSEPFYGFSIIIEGMMMGVGNTKQPLIFNMVGMWGVRVLGTLICTKAFGLGLITAWGCMIAHNLLVFTLYLYCYASKKWNPLECSTV